MTLDVIVRLAGPIADGGDTDAEIRLVPGGQAANVAAWAASLGATARFMGRTGDDDAGSIARACWNASRLRRSMRGRRPEGGAVTQRLLSASP